MKPFRLLASGLPLALLLATGCASQPPESATPAPRIAAPETTPTPKAPAKAGSSDDDLAPAIPSRPFDRETLFELLVAEFAGKRERPELALNTYVKSARKTRDPLVAERATSIARFMGANQAALDSALLWAEVDGDNPAAREAAATMLIRFNRLDEGMNHVEKLLEQDVELNFDFLLNATRSADSNTITLLIARLDRLLAKYPENHQLWFSRGLLRHEQDKTQGLDDIEQALELQPEYTNALIAKARMLEERDEQRAARKLLAGAAAVQPENKRLGLSYARLLLRQKRMDDAQQQFATLADTFPDDTDLSLSLALVAWENEAEDVAVAQLMKLVETERASEARSYLGRIAASRDQKEVAIEHFRMVDAGPHFTPARIQLAALLADQGQLESARQTLAQARQRAPQDALQYYMMESEVLSKAGRADQALTVLEQAMREQPDDHDLAYAHAMMLGELERYDEMEHELRALIAKAPDNPDALNALGYTFADRNVRLDEAEALLGRALALAPKNPAVIDSMGWLKFRRGEHQAALELLRRAYKDFPDHEVAAHLGEVLWVMGEQQEALEIWREALKKTPDSKLVKNAMQRLMPALPTEKK